LDVNLLVDFVSSTNLGKLTEVCEKRRCFIVEAKSVQDLFPEVNIIPNFPQKEANGRYFFEQALTSYYYYIKQICPIVARQ
jgi:hypothetical protein